VALFNVLRAENNLRAASPKYQPDPETAKKPNLPKPAQNEAPQAPVTKTLLQVRQIKNYPLHATFSF